MIYTEVTWNDWNSHPKETKAMYKVAYTNYVTDIGANATDPISTHYDPSSGRLTVIRQWESEEHAQGWLQLVDYAPHTVFSKRILTELPG